MFSSLPSASKIYVRSSKSRQKSAASSRRKKKRAHTASSSCDVGRTDATLVSLISHDFDPHTVKSFSENCREFCIEDLSPSSEILDRALKADCSVFSEDSEILEEVSSGLFVGDFRTESSVLEVGNLAFNNENLNVTHEAEEVDSVRTDANLDEGFLENDVGISKNTTLDNLDSDNHSDSSFSVNLLDDASENTTDIFNSEGCLENVSTCNINIGLTDNDLSDKMGLLECIAEDSSDVKYISESTITVKNKNTKGILNNLSTDCISTGGLGDHVSKHTLNLSETGDPVTKVILECITDDLERDSSALPTSNPSKEHKNPSNLDPKTLSMTKGTDCSDITDGLDQSSPDDRQEEEAPQRTESTEHSELSCTESIYKSKSPVLEDMKTSAACIAHSLQPSNVCRSYSDLGSIDASDLKRCSSFPKSLTSLGEAKKMSLDSLDKGTATTNFPCRNCGSVEVMDARNVGFNLPLHTSRAVSANLEEAASRNVLPPLTTTHARARSYVFGNTGHTGSLLGNNELNRFFPDSQVKIFVGTWNMNSHSPPKNIDDFLLPLDIDLLPDIYAVGVQEGMQSRFEWDVLLQSTLGPSHVLLASTSLGVLHLSVFVRRDLVWFCSEPEDASVATRPGTLVKTKGAVGVAFTFFGTSFLFVNSHLAAHEQKLKERLLDYEKICSSLELPKATPARDKDVTSRFDVVLWCGDLNFRVERDRPSVLSFVEQRMCKSRPSCSFLVKHDQLYKAMKEGAAFTGFREGVIHFNPSYKFDVGTTNAFTYAQLRVPSYTDRILYRFRERSPVTCLHYDAVPSILTSDHKPVFGVFRAALRPGKDK